MRTGCASGKPAAAFNPAVGSATLKSYYDADTGVTNVSGKASVWADQGPAADNFNQFTAGNRLTILSNWRNGHAALYSAPTTDAGMSATVDTIAQPLAIYAVTEWASPGTTGQQRPFIKANGDVLQFGQVANATVGAGQAQYIQLGYMYSGTTQVNMTTSPPAPGTPCIVRMALNGSSSVLRVTPNGGVEASVTGNAGATGYGGVSSIGLLGNNNWQGKIASIIIYSGIPDATDDAYIMNALGSKYAIRLAPYRLPVVSCVGNSLTFGAGLTDLGNVPNYLQRSLGGSARCDNWGHAAYTTPQLTALLPTEGLTSLVGTPCVMYLWEGGNDLLSGSSPTLAWTHYLDFLATARLGGWYQPIIINTIGPRGDVAQWKIDEFNSLMLSSWEAAGFDGCLTGFGYNPVLQFPGNTDQVHYTYQQNVIIGQMWSDYIQALLGLPAAT